MWQRLEESTLRNAGGNNAKVKRVYGMDGQPWPRLIIAIYEYNASGVKLTCSIKDKPGSWWEGDSGIPKQLLDEAAEMLKEYASRT